MKLILITLSLVGLITGNPRTLQVREGVEGIFELLDHLEEELSKNIIFPSSKIVNGTLSSEGQFPFIVSLKIKNYNRYQHFCGGSAITTSHILTAAHCVDYVSLERLYVSIGDHDSKKKDRYEEIIPASEIILHKDFNPSNFENDIAIVKLRTPFTLHNRRQTIGMMEDRNMLQNLYNEDSAPDLTVLGWGTLSEGGPLPRILNYVKLPYVEHGVCRAAMSPYPVFDEMLCAGDVEKGQIDACQGDSGGPIVYRKEFKKEESQKRTFLYGPEWFLKNADIFARPSQYEVFDYEDKDQRIIEHGWELAGLVSWGIGCAKPGYAGIYTNVGHYKQWIADKIGKNY